MPRLAANLSTMFREVPFLERFERAREALAHAVTVAPEGSRPADRPLVIDRITAD